MRAALLAIALVVIAPTALGETLDGAAVFSQNCATCHAAAGSGRAPSREGLRLLQPKFVTDTLESGAMRLQGMRLNPSEMRAVAEYVTGKTLTTESFDPSVGRCATPKPMAPVAAGPHWSGRPRTSSWERRYHRFGDLPAGIHRAKLRLDALRLRITAELS